MDVADVTGPFGKFQQRIFFVLLLRAVCAAFIIMTYQLISFPVEFECSGLRLNSSHELLDSTEPPFDINSTSVFLEPLGSDGGVSGSEDQCFVPAFNSSEESKCQEFRFVSSEYTTVVQEWSLVCDRNWIIAFGYMVLILGNFVSYIPAGALADRYGRLPVTLMGQGVITITSFLLYFSNSMPMFLGLRFVIGLGFGFMQNAIICIFLESIGPKYRDLTVVSFAGFWGIGIMLLSGLSYFITDWRNLVLATSFPLQLPLFILSWWLVPESTKWLISVKQYDRAERQLIRQAKQNGRPITNAKEIINILKDRIEMDMKSEKVGLRDILKNRKICRIAFALYSSFFLTVFIYNGFMVTIGRLGGSIRMNMFWSGLIETPVVFFYFLIVKYFNRRNGLLVNFLFCGVMFLTTLVIPKEYHSVGTGFAMLGRMCNSLAYILLYVFATELFPTSMRGAAISGAMVSGRLGGLLAPFMDLVSGRFGKWVPNTIYGALSLLTILLFLALPKTQYENLPDTLAQSEKLADGPKEDIFDISTSSGESFLPPDVITVKT